MSLWFVCRSEGWQHYDSEGWGACLRFVEVGDDQLARRQIEVYDSGEILVYERKHARDRFGQLMGLRFSKKDKWRDHFEEVESLSEQEFERAWKLYSPLALEDVGAV